MVENTAISNSVGNGYGGGIYFTGDNTLTIGNSIVSGDQNFDPINRPDIAAGPGYTLVTTGFNLIGSNVSTSTDFPAGSPNGFNDYAGTNASPLNAGLETLGDFGGPTPQCHHRQEVCLLITATAPGKRPINAGLLMAIPA